MLNDDPTATGAITVVLGGSGAIGSAIAARLRETGRRVVVLDRAQPPHPCAAFEHADITCETSVTGAITRIARRFGTPDALICTAGHLTPGSVLDLRAEDIQRHFDINLLGAFRVAQAVAHLMIGTGGKILFVSSIHGQIGVPNRTAYAISKAALGALARGMAVELSHHKIRVNVLAPGAVDGGMGPNPSARGMWQRDTPSGRVARVEEIARFAAMLTSDDASFVTGQTIAMDGGASNLRPHGLLNP